MPCVREKEIEITAKKATLKKAEEALKQLEGKHSEDVEAMEKY